MMETQTLFEDIRVSPAEKKRSRLADRKRKMHLAYKYSSEKWKEAYERFILAYAEGHETFIAESVRKSYEEHTNLPQLHGSDYRASGALFMKLVKEGKLVRIGYGDSVERSSPMPLYRQG